VVLVHGRGATALSILELGREIGRDRLAVLAPQAANNTWYLESFLAPGERNEPGRSSGLRAVDDAIETATSSRTDTDYCRDLPGRPHTFARSIRNRPTAIAMNRPH
jgi:phospholipase/carboxylesterase